MSDELKVAVKEAEQAIKKAIILAVDSGELVAAMRAMIRALTSELPYQEAAK